jgi:hypothetical protein
MVRNVGGIDRGVRIAAGLALAAWALFGTGEYHQWGWLGVVPLFTGLIGWCPPYSLLGINTCAVKRA